MQIPYDIFKKQIKVILDSKSFPRDNYESKFPRIFSNCEELLSIKVEKLFKGKLYDIKQLWQAIDSVKEKYFEGVFALHMIDSAFKEILFGVNTTDNTIFIKIMKYFKKKEYDEYLEY